MSNSSQPSDKQAILRKALAEIRELHTQLDTMKQAEREPIAIIGMGCRLPGNVYHPLDLWELLLNGVDTISEVPDSRWNIEHYYDPDATTPGKMNTRWGGFLQDVTQFDADFFGISPREANYIDPQQRLLLEVAWEALEYAGQTKEDITASPTGVFLGACNTDYSRLNFSYPDDLNAYVGAGSAISIIANRLSYLLDLHGPSLVVDTACSSSLVAVHLACQSLRQKECDLAISGGVNLMLTPEMTILTTKWGMMAPDGRCKTFDSQADGYVRGEGCGVIILKRLSDALAHGDQILALIRGSAVNQDGRSNGLTAPNLQAQQAVLLQAIQNSHVQPEQISYIETHGTGTSLGDPIEVEALKSVYGKNRSKEHPCFLGAIKTNIGHLEGAAGIAGLLKAILVLQHGKIPPNLHLQTLNPNIELAGLPFVFPATVHNWPSTQTRFAGISAFGFGGTNAHVILEQAPICSPQQDQHEQILNNEVSYLLPLSAQTSEALIELATHYYHWFEKQPDLSLRDICFTASLGRTHHDYRLALVGSTVSDFSSRLNDFIEKRSQNSLMAGYKVAGQPKKVVFVFSGQGTQWVLMGSRLLEQEEIFRATVEQCDALLQEYVTWSLIEELQAPKGASRLDQTEITQPVLFAIQVGLVALWRSWGITPDVVIGHSLGEVAAAYTAGALSLHDAIRVVAQRGKHMQAGHGQGTMASIGLSREATEQLLIPSYPTITIGAVNSPTTTVVSGPSAAIEDFVLTATQHHIYAKQHTVAYAFHSPQMASIAEDLTKALQGLRPQKTNIPFISTVTGSRLDGTQIDAAYWGRNVREPVLFAQAIEYVTRESECVFAEISAHPALSVPIEQCLEQQGQTANIINNLRQGQDERTQLLKGLGKAYTLGYIPHWKKLFRPAGQIVSLPTYAWQHKHYWIATHAIPHDRSQTNTLPWEKHPLLQKYVALSTQHGTHCWEVQINGEDFFYLKDHLIQQGIVLPGSLYLEIALAAGQLILQTEALQLTHVVFSTMCTIDATHYKTLQMVFTEIDDKEKVQFHISSRQEKTNQWIEHANGFIQKASLLEETSQDSFPSELQQGRQIDGKQHYQSLQNTGVYYGPNFQGIEHAWCQNGEVLAQIRIPTSIEASLPTYLIHPALLDMCFQVTTIPIIEANNAAIETLYLPVGVTEMRYLTPPPSTNSQVFWVYTQQQDALNEEHTTSPFIKSRIVLMDADHHVLLHVQDLQLQRVHLQPSINRERLAHWLYKPVWQHFIPSPSHERVPKTQGTWLLFGNRQEISETLIAQLTLQNVQCVKVNVGETFQKENNTCYQLNPTNPDDIILLLKSLDAQLNAKITNIVYFCDTTLVSATKEFMYEELLQIQQTTCESVLTLIQTIVQMGWRNTPRLWLITHGAQNENATFLPDGIGLAQAPLWGLAKTVSHEHPNLSCSCIDLPKNITEEVQQTLFTILTANGKENRILLRPDGLYVARLVSSDTPTMQSPTASPLFKQDKTYLIIGGLGGLGFTIARWAVNHGAKTLVLVGRNNPSMERQAELSQLRNANADVDIHVIQTDITQPEQAETLFKHIKETLPSLDGIFHTAGIIEDASLLRLTPTQFRKVMAPKLVGAWNLHRLTSHESLTYFVLFSSVASLLGSPGQGNYAAANAFLDALAHYRHAKGLAAQSINWGPWAEVGMAASLANRGKRQIVQGITPMTPDQGTELLEIILTEHASLPQIAVMNLNLRQWRQSYPVMAQSPFLSDLQEMQGGTLGAKNAKTSLTQQLRMLNSHEEQEYHLQDYLKNLISSIFDISPTRLDILTPLNTLGLDSLMAVELRNRLEAELELSLPVTLAWAHPTVTALTLYLFEALQLPVYTPHEDIPTNTQLFTQQLLEQDGEDVFKLVHALEQLSSDDVQQLFAAIESPQEGIS